MVVNGLFNSYAARSNIRWSADFNAGEARARNEAKPILLSFTSSNCVWCRKMDTETFRNPELAGLSRKVVCVQVDCDNNPAVAAKYGVVQTPVTVLVSPDGKEKWRAVGYCGSSDLTYALRDLSGTKN